MREIKFRGKREDDNDWVYGSLVYDDYKKPWIGSIKVCGDPDETLDFCEPIYNEKTIGQYTGLKDANGIEIYEGDILSSGDGMINKVEWWDNEWVAAWFKRGNMGRVFSGRPKLGFRHHTVIGNIHDNPELLEK